MFIFPQHRSLWEEDFQKRQVDFYMFQPISGFLLGIRNFLYVWNLKCGYVLENVESVCGICNGEKFKIFQYSSIATKLIAKCQVIFVGISRYQQ